MCARGGFGNVVAARTSIASFRSHRLDTSVVVRSLFTHHSPRPWLLGYQGYRDTHMQ